MITLKHHEIPKLPDRFTCPICKAKIFIEEITEWEQMDDGTWKAGDCGVIIQCVTEPDIESEDWNGWMDGHWSMPYSDWLPLSERVQQWLDANYRFEVGT